jgi:NADH-quinone oxidoreductase subunit N
VFSAALATAPYGAALVLVGVLASAIAVFFYVRVIVLMYFSEATGDAVTVSRPGALTIVAVGVGVFATVILGVMPNMALELAQSSSVFLP